jgi:glycosyltransferase involved in cell wall biosynthesis
MVGLRGVPATWGGIERHVEELGARLVERGHDVTVYCRRGYNPEAPARFRGMELRQLPAVPTKHLEAISHTALAVADAMRAGFDVIHLHAIGPGVLSPLPRYLSRAKVVVTIHGRDDQRLKWGGVAQRALRAGAWVSTRVPDATISVSRSLADDYRAAGRAVTYIPNGVDAPERREAKIIRDRWALTAGDYLLFVGRIVPEKMPDTLVRAFRRLTGDTRLVIVGGSSFTDDYCAGVERLAAADPRVLLTGYVYGDELAELYTNAAAFVLPSQLEGLPTTLLEALSYGTPAVASEIPAHREVLGVGGPGGRLFPAGDEAALVRTLTETIADPAAERAGAAVLRDHVLANYAWSDVADATDRLYRDLTGRAGNS